MADDGPPPCAGCAQPMSGKFVRALGGVWHLACFTCIDCGAVVANKYYEADGRPVCERDHFRRRRLLCARCDEPIRGASLTALDRAFHPEHFVCSACGTRLVDPDSADSAVFYEHTNQPYCRLHFSVSFAQQCAACNMAILRQVVDDGQCQWHVDCYKVYQIWNVSLPPPQDVLQAIPLTDWARVDEARAAFERLQVEVEERVNNTFAVLWTFEEAVAHCIAETVISYDEYDFARAPDRALAIVACAEVLLNAMDTLALPGMADDDWAQFTTAIDRALEFVDQSYKTSATIRRRQNNTKVLLEFATDVARHFKATIRKCLEVVLAQDKGRVNALMDQFVALLRESYQGSSSVEHASAVVDSAQVKEQILAGPTGLVFGERLVRKPLQPAEPATPTVAGDQYERSKPTFVVTTRPPGGRRNRHIVTLVELVEKRLGFLRTAPAIVYEDREPEQKTNAVAAAQTSEQQDAYESDDDNDTDAAASAAATVADAVPAGMRGSGSLANLSIPEVSAQLQSPAADEPSLLSPRTPTTPKQLIKDDAERPSDVNSIRESFNRMSMSSTFSFRVHMPPPSEQEKRVQYVANLSAIELMMVRQMAVLRLSQLLGNQYSLGDIMKLTQVQDRKPLLQRIFQSFRVNRKKRESSAFGMSLEEAVERSGVDSSLGVGPASLRIPVLIEKTINYMDKHGLNQEGLFRKSGSAKRINELREQFSKGADVSRVDLSQASPLDVAALIKRYFRELSEPLLTFNFFDLFMASQQFEDKKIRNEIIHLLLLLLPKAHRDVVEVFMAFLKRVAQHAHASATGGQPGNLMTEANLAVCLAPSLLIARTADRDADDGDHHKTGAHSAAALSQSAIGSTFLTPTTPTTPSVSDVSDVFRASERQNSLAISVVTSMIKHHLVFAKVPDHIAAQLVKPKQMMGL